MSFEANLMAEAQRVAGDDTIQEVADFQPKGTAGAAAAGAAAGAVLGGAAVDGDGLGDSLAQSAGAAGGALAGRAVVHHGRKLPLHLAVAVSPTEVFVFGMKGSGWSPHLELLGKIDRDKLGVEVHQRISVRTVVLEDLETETKYELEVGRLNFFHAKALVELLMMSESYHDEELSEEGEFAPSA